MHDEAGAKTALASAPQRVVGSDPHDFAGLYVRHRSSFTSHARRYLRDPRDADEVVQEAFLRLFLALPELETELQALAYCRRTITNLCIDRYRADARRPRLVALEGPTVDELAEDDAGDPVVRAEDAALVREALSRLPELHRAALVKREVEEKPLPVIAAELDVAEDSLKHLLFRARRALRTLLAATSVAPGADVERARRLRPAASGASGGLAGVLVLLLIGLGSGPDLRAVPVVGVDLPDVLGVTAVVDAVGDVVSSAVEVLVPGERVEAAPRPQEPGRAGEQSSTDARSAAPDEGAGSPAPAARGSGPQAARQPAAAQQAPAAQDRAQPTTVVDGRPVTPTLTQAAAPVTGGGATQGRAQAPASREPLRAADRGSAAAVAAPALPGGERRATINRAPVPAAGDVPGHAATSHTAERAERAPAAAEQAADRAERAQERAADKAERAQERAADRTERAQERAADRTERAADRAAVATGGGAAVAAQEVAEKAAAKAVKVAEKAAAKAERAAQRAAVEQQEAAAAAVVSAATEVPSAPAPAAAVTGP